MSVKYAAWRKSFWPHDLASAVQAEEFAVAFACLHQLITAFRTSSRGGVSIKACRWPLLYRPRRCSKAMR